MILFILTKNFQDLGPTHIFTFFHPDYYRRPWHLTRSADLPPVFTKESARGLPDLFFEGPRYRRWRITLRPEGSYDLSVREGANNNQAEITSAYFRRPKPIA